jgi:putative lysine transport system substrate-binding protein/putative lysine transport system permease protein
VKFESGKGFTADASVSIAVAKNNTDLQNKIDAVLNTISEDERQQMMLDAVNRQPANE